MTGSGSHTSAVPWLGTFAQYRSDLRQIYQSIYNIRKGSNVLLLYLGKMFQSYFSLFLPHYKLKFKNEGTFC